MWRSACHPACSGSRKLSDIVERGTLYLTREGLRLERLGHTLCVYEDGELLQRIPVSKVRDIVTCSSVGLGPSVISLCFEEQIPIHFTRRGDRYLGSLIYTPRKNLFLRKVQMSWHMEEARRLETAKKIVRNKKTAMDDLLRSYHFRPLEEIAWEGISTLDQLRGTEGGLTKAYYREFGRLIKKQSFRFDGRNKRPPRDPINALLSLAYTLLYDNCLTAALLAGFDPYFGFLHEEYYGRPSLACDLQEEWRPTAADRFVLNLIHREEVSPADFRDHGLELGVRLEEKKYAEVLKKWGEFLNDERHAMNYPRPVSFQRAIHHQARLLSQYLQGDRQDFPPFRLKG